MRRQSCLGIVSVAAAFAIGPRIGAQAAPRSLREFLTRVVRMAPGQLDAVERGDVVVATLPTADQRDVTVLGVVRLNRARGVVVNDARASARLAQAGGGTRGAAHVFAVPATLDNVAALQLTHDDLDDLAHCEPNACNFKLPAADMAALRALAVSKSPDALQRATEYLRRRIVDYVTSYRQRGNAAMVVYDDLGSVQSASAFDAMLHDSSSVFRVAPTLGRFLLDYPRTSLPDESDAIFWSVDALPHVRQVMRIVHEVTYVPAEIPGATVIATKQLYADHYFEAGLELLTAIDDSVAGFNTSRRGTAVVALRHYRFDHLPSGGLLNVRGRVIGGLRDAVAADLERLRGDDAR